MISKHGFSGSCAPGAGGFWAGHFNTFSLGVFEMIPSKTKTGWKKGPVKVRVSGSTLDEKKVKAKAQEIVEALDSGTYKGPKKIKV